MRPAGFCDATIQVCGRENCVLSVLALAVFFYLISGFWDLQVRNPEFYSEKAERNRIKALPFPPLAERSWTAMGG